MTNIETIQRITKERLLRILFISNNCKGCIFKKECNKQIKGQCEADYREWENFIENN